jgi:hypothetical protein
MRRPFGAGQESLLLLDASGPRSTAPGLRVVAYLDAAPAP